MMALPETMELPVRMEPLATTPTDKLVQARYAIVNAHLELQALLVRLDPKVHPVHLVTMDRTEMAESDQLAQPVPLVMLAALVSPVKRAHPAATVLSHQVAARLVPPDHLVPLVHLDNLDKLVAPTVTYRPDHQDPLVTLDLMAIQEVLDSLADLVNLAHEEVLETVLNALHLALPQDTDYKTSRLHACSIDPLSAKYTMHMIIICALWNYRHKKFLHGFEIFN